MIQAPGKDDTSNEPALIWVGRHNWRPETAFVDIALLDRIDVNRLEQPGRFEFAVYDSQAKLVASMLARPGVFEAAHEPESFTEPDKLLFLADRLRRYSLAADRWTDFTYDARWLTRLSAMTDLGTRHSSLFLRCCNEMHPDVERRQWLMRTLESIEATALQNGMTEINPVCDALLERSVQDDRSQALIGLWIAQVISRGQVDDEQLMHIFARFRPAARPRRLRPDWLIETYCPEALNDWAMIDSLDLGLQDAHDLVWGADMAPEPHALPMLG